MAIFPRLVSFYFKLARRTAYLFFILWMLFCTFLFCLPGSVIQSSSWLDSIYFDKWVHTGLFMIAGFLGASILWANKKPLNQYYSLILFTSLSIYGASIELVQHYFIANRSMDIYDLWADMVGILAGMYLYKKIKPL